jgi:hypothetical protein
MRNMKPKRFQKKTEDFVCNNCGLFVKGSGYTNHCPRCLYSKHVDQFPGDRQEQCGGVMKPIGIKTKNGQHTIIHKCMKCGAVRPVKAARDDFMDEIIALSVRPVSA